jgi:hypothetical protein
LNRLPAGGRRDIRRSAATGTASSPTELYVKQGNAQLIVVRDEKQNGKVSYQSIEVTTLVAKYVINQFYGVGPDHSYWVGCSTEPADARVW